MVYEIKNGKVIINVKAQPNSSKNKIAGIYGESLKINIKAPAVEGAANKELIKFMSKEFKIPKSEIELKGETSKRKQLILPLNEKLKKFLESLE
ncbi:MAG: YggU family protein [Epsilonproteobacteria bacterium]|nr:YggU family protein [Campylobacterota bacterium]